MNPLGYPGICRFSHWIYFQKHINTPSPHPHSHITDRNETKWIAHEKWTSKCHKFGVFWVMMMTMMFFIIYVIITNFHEFRVDVYLLSYHYRIFHAVWSIYVEIHQEIVVCVYFFESFRIEVLFSLSLSLSIPLTHSLITECMFIGVGRLLRSAYTL